MTWFTPAILLTGRPRLTYAMIVLSYTTPCRRIVIRDRAATARSRSTTQWRIEGWSSRGDRPPPV